MNSTQAKKVLITDYLNLITDYLNIHDNIDKNEFFITSPFNQSEKTPSFRINVEKNIWYDHSMGLGGNIIDLVMILNNCSFAQALKHLKNLDFSFHQQKEPIFKIEKQEIQIIKKIKNLENPALIQYLNSRKINIEIAKIYLEEIYYKQGNKHYFSLAFKNDSEGYETRNAYFKGCIGAKDITTIKSLNNDTLSLFEGFMDFLSALTYFKKVKFKNDVIILNSISNLKKVNFSAYKNKKIYLFLDNDKAGKDTKKALYLENSNCVDCSNLYAKFKDFNDFLMSI